MDAHLRCQRCGHYMDSPSHEHGCSQVKWCEDCEQREDLCRCMSK